MKDHSKLRYHPSAGESHLNDLTRAACPPERVSRYTNVGRGDVHLPSSGTGSRIPVRFAPAGSESAGLVSAVSSGLECLVVL